MNELEYDRFNHIGTFITLEEVEFRKIQEPHQTSNPPQTPPSSPKLNSLNTSHVASQNTRVDEDEFLSYLKRPLTARILAKIISRKKSQIY